MDSSKKIAQVKEQVKLENVSRRRYPDRWGKLSGSDVNRFYNQDEVNKYMKAAGSSDYKEIYPYTHTGHGDSYFVSKDMYESLVAKCRCGRRRTEGHTIKCLQKVQSKHLNGGGNDNDIAAPLSSIASGDDDDVPGKRIHGKYANDDWDDSLGSFNDSSQSRGDGVRRCRIPETSNGMIGWPDSRYSRWEQSAKYVSPIATMAGYRITERPYSVIFIG